MPWYEYRCDPCERLEADYRRVANRNILPVCPKCDSPMRRLVARNTMAITDRYADQRENKWGLTGGVPDYTELKEQIREGDKAYEGKWKDKNTPVGPKTLKVTSMLDTAKKMGIPISG